MNVSYAIIFLAIIPVVMCNRERKITEILDSVRRIEEHITKEDRLREITDIVRIESNVEKLGAKLDRVLNILDTSVPPPIGRSHSGAVVPRDLGSNLESIQNRLQNLELSVGSVEEGMKKMDFDPTTVNEIERRTTQLKDDMNAKLRKIMNVLTALYELNKDMKVNVESRSEPQEQKKTESGSSTFATEFVMEGLDELEKKIKEQFSVLTSELRSEVTSLKILTSSNSANCDNKEEDEEEWLTPMSSRSNRNPNSRSLAGNSNSLENLVESLGRSTREIRQEIQQGIQGLDTKLENLTAIAQNQPNCADSLDFAESVVSGRRVPFGIPVQSVEENQNVKKAKNDSCSRSAQNVPNPKSCADLRQGGATCNGIYVIFPKGRRAVRVFCDMTTDGGGWTVLMRRGNYGDKMTSFHRNWLSYKNGFGDAEGEFWLGNDVIHFMTTEEANVLRIHMSAFDGDEIDLDYSNFSIGNETNHYRLDLGVPLGRPNAVANSLRYHNHHPFSTFDRKNDNFDQNCASTYKGGWWFNGCYFGFLTGEYFGLEDKRENWQGILWYDWKGNAALKGAEMLIRPKAFAA